MPVNAGQMADAIGFATNNPKKQMMDNVDAASPPTFDYDLEMNKKALAEGKQLYISRGTIPTEVPSSHHRAGADHGAKGTVPPSVHDTQWHETGAPEYDLEEDYLWQDVYG